MSLNHDKHTKALPTQFSEMAPHLQYSPRACLLAASPPGVEKEPNQPITRAERLQTRKDLQAYCGLDTEAMVEICLFISKGA